MPDQCRDIAHEKNRFARSRLVAGVPRAGCLGTDEAAVQLSIGRIPFLWRDLARLRCAFGICHAKVKRAHWDMLINL